MRVAGIDIGTTRVKLAIYESDGSLAGFWSKPSPLRWTRGRAEHDPGALRVLLADMLEKARREGARAVGVSLYRASVAAWEPGGHPITSVALWLDRALHAEAHRRHPQARIWTLDALIHEWIGAGYKTEPTGAALTGLINPRTLRPIKPLWRLAGLQGLRPPGLGENTLPNAPSGVSAVISDQQAALLALGCGGDCVKLSLGTGFFADRPYPGPPPLNPGRGLLPIVHYRAQGETRWAIESLAPGAGLAVQGLAEAIGGFQLLHALRPRDCRWWEGSILIPYPAGPGAGVGAERALLIGNPAPRGRHDAACAIIAGVAATASLLLSLHKPGWTTLHLTGSLTSIPLIAATLARLTPAKTYHCPQDPTPLGAAKLAATALGLDARLQHNCNPLEGSTSNEYQKLAKALQSILDSTEAKGDAVETIYNTILDAINEISV